MVYHVVPLAVMDVNRLTSRTMLLLRRYVLHVVSAVINGAALLICHLRVFISNDEILDHTMSSELLDEAIPMISFTLLWNYGLVFYDF